MKKINLVFLVSILVLMVVSSIGMLSYLERKGLEETKEVASNFSISKLQWKTNEVRNNEVVEETTAKQIEAYQNMPNKIKGYNVIGQLKIPKIELDTYILEETNKKTLDISVTKLEGPNVNEVGNLCITGHNYLNAKMFGKLRKLEIGDEITLVDPYDRQVSYQVYEINKVSPKDVSCISQDTKGDREVTLITCTIGAIQRLVIKCIEIYD